MVACKHLQTGLSDGGDCVVNGGDLHDKLRISVAISPPGNRPANELSFLTKRG